MIVEDKRATKSKAISFTSLMKNPKLAEIIFASWDAKPGSTKKLHARSILKSVHKVHSGYAQDGQGGSFNFFSPLQQNSPTAIMSKPQDPMMSVQPPTDLGEQQNTIPKATRFIKTIDQFIPSPSATPTGIAASNLVSAANVVGALPQTTNTSRLGGAYNTVVGAAGQVQPLIDKTKESIAGLGKAAAQMGTEAYIYPFKAAEAVGQYLTAPEKPEFKLPSFNLPKMDTPLTRWLSTLMTGKTTTPVATATVPVIQKNPETGKVEVGDSGKTAGDTDSLSLGSTVETNYNTLSEMPVDELDQWYQSLSAEEQAKVHDVYDAVKSGVGASTWKIQALTNRQTLKNLGLPDSVIDSLPSTGLLSTGLNELWESTKKSYQLDTQLQRLMDLQNQGMTIEEDAKAYIRGKDEYLGTIDKLLDDAVSISAKMDTSNPYIAQRIGNYTNYLTVLQGRQTQRYADFLNTAVNYHTAQLSQATNLYNSSFQQAQELYNKSASVTAESYNQIGTMLEDMYKNIEGRTEQMRKDTQWEWEKTKTEYDQLNQVLKNTELLNKLDGTSVDYDKVSNFDTYQQFILGMHADKDGNLTFDSYDPFQILQTAKNNNYNQQDALTKFSSASGANIHNYAKNGQFMDELGKYKDVFKSYLTSGATDTDIASYGQMWSALATPLRSSLVDGIKEFLSADDSKTNTLREMLKSLSGTGWFKKSKTSTDKQNFVNSYRSSMGDIAGIVFDIYQAVLAQGKGSVKPEDVYGELLKLDDSSLEKELSYEIADYIMQLQN